MQNGAAARLARFARVALRSTWSQMTKMLVVQPTALADAEVLARVLRLSHANAPPHIDARRGAEYTPSLRPPSGGRGGERRQNATARAPPSLFASSLYEKPRRSRAHQPAGSRFFCSLRSPPYLAAATKIAPFRRTFLPANLFARHFSFS